MVVSRVNCSEDLNIVFEGTDQAIRIVDCHEIVAVLAKICPNWSFNTLAASNNSSSMRVVKRNSKYELSSPFMDSPRSYSDPVDTACAIVVELAWSSLRANPNWLCLHCAAIEINGRLILLPNARRSGKSTLSTLLGLRGHQIFTDDFLAIEVGDDNGIAGISSGVATRMRLPWPEEFSRKTNAQLLGSVVAANHQYSYHTNGVNMPRERGHHAPIGAIVTLAMVQNSKPKLRAMGIQATLRTIILQNFSRAVNSGNILKILFAIVSQSKLFELSYSSAEDAVALIENQLGSWDAPPPTLATPLSDMHTISGSGEMSIPPAVSEKDVLKKSDHVTEYNVENIRFLADPNGRAILQLDEMSSAIWKLLERPIKVSEVVSLFCDAFPDISRETVSADVIGLIEELWKCDLLKTERDNSECSRPET